MPIHDVGYRGWDGARTSPLSRWWIISKTGIRLAAKSRWVRRILFVSWLPVMYWGIGFFFVDDQYVVNEVARIMPIMTIMFFIAGPLIMISHYFQAIGDAGRAAILGLSKTYLFSIPLTFLLPFTFGEKGIWMAGPIAEILLLGLTLIVLTKTARQHDLKWGLFKSER